MFCRSRAATLTLLCGVMTFGVTEMDDRRLSTVFGKRDKPKQPLPTLDQFRRAHESLWMRAADLAAYEDAQQARIGSPK